MRNSLPISSFNFCHFRGLNDLSIDNLSNINIFVGANNSGKTSVLEAIKLMSAPSDVGQLVRLALLRAQAGAENRKKNLVNCFLNLFQKTTDEEERQSFYRIELSADIFAQKLFYEADGSVGQIVTSSGEDRKTFDFSYAVRADGAKSSPKSIQIVNGEDTQFAPTEKPIYNALYIHSNVSTYRSCANLLSDYIVTEGKREILQILQSFEKEIDDISIVGEDIYLHNTKSGSLPLFAYGSGLQKALLLTTALVYCKGGVFLADEIDNAIHVSAFEDFFMWFFDACIKYNVQAFITTHNAEAIDAILKTAHSKHSEADILRVITLRKDSSAGITRKKIRTGEEAFSDRDCYKMELRV